MNDFKTWNYDKRDENPIINFLSTSSYFVYIPKLIIRLARVCLIYKGFNKKRCAPKTNKIICWNRVIKENDIDCTVTGHDHELLDRYEEIVSQLTNDISSRSYNII